VAIKYIGFDCGNVLVQFDTERFYSFVRRHGKSNLEPQELFSGSKVHIIKGYDLGKLDDEEFFSQVKEAFQLGEVPSEVFFYLMSAIVIPDYKMLELRDNFRRRGVGTVLISNMNNFHFRYLMGKYPEVLSGFDYSMISSHEGVAKPDTEAWIRPLDYLGIKGEGMVYIDDVFENVQVACDLGIRGWHYNVKDKNFLSCGALERERGKFGEFLELMWNKGILKPYENK